MPEEPLKLRFGGSLVEQLGAQLYPSATATIAELISNAWDADARNVWIDIPLDDNWEPGTRITVVDDGTGMTRTDAQNAYLIVGRKKRLVAGRFSGGGRKFHGRKGIGKLAAFGTAGTLECATLKEGQLTTFRLDYDGIRKLQPDVDYPVEPALDTSPPVNPQTGELLPHGTRINLGDLRLRRAISEEEFLRSMSRRFSIDAGQMTVWINGVALERFNIPLQFRFPQDGVPHAGVSIGDDGWAVETLAGDREVRWWVGFTEKPIDDENAIGVSLLANDKMAQRPFEFDRTKGLSAQLGLEYIVGEVKADWLDEGVDADTDFIQSNRDHIQVEDARLDDFMRWGRKLVDWSVRTWGRLRADKNLTEFNTTPELDALLKDYTKGEQQKLMTIAKKVSSLPALDSADVVSVVRDIVNAREDRYVRQLLEEIEVTDESMQPKIWELVHEFGLIDARRTLSLVEARLGAIAKLREALDHGAKEVPEIHRIIKEDPWLVDPRWSLLDDEVDLSSLGIDFEPGADDETGATLDFLFVLRPRSPAALDQVVVLEIKRATDSQGRVRKASLPEVNKFHAYVSAVASHYERSTERPVVRGMMICEGYTAQADTIRRGLEQIQSPKMEFKTWGRAIEDTENLHLGWLDISKRRTLPE
jgi:Histidine kinase-, DNA gyrase B-, and HSP90-like ATPase